MTDKSFKTLVPVKYFIEPGYIFIATKPTIISGVLGSCVAVSLFDRKRKTGGMNLFQYPYIKEKHLATARYGNISTITLIRMMLDNGSKIKNLEAQILGGAYNSKISPKDIGKDNIMIARKILAKNCINVVSEDISGKKGRKIVFNTIKNEIAVMKVDKLRADDWYPYKSKR